MYLVENSLLDNENILNGKRIKSLLKTYKIDSSKIDTNSSEDILTHLYNNLSSERDKYNFIYDVLQANEKDDPRYRDASNFRDVIVKSIEDKGFDSKDNTFLHYVENLPVTLSRKDALLVYTLFKRGVATPESAWLYNKSFYNERPEDLQYKLKAILFVNDKNQLRNFMDPHTIDTNKLVYNKDNSISTAAEMRKKLEQAQTRSGDDYVTAAAKRSASSGLRGKNIIAQALNIRLDLPQDKLRDKDIIDYILTLPDSRFRGANEILATAISTLRKDVDKVLERSFKDKESFDRYLAEWLYKNVSLYRS